MLARLGNVFYWLGCAGAAFAGLMAVTVMLSPGRDAGIWILTYLASGLVAWVVGLACPYVLAGT
jgi:hypothetical protein